MKITPRCTGWIPNARPSGTISGATTAMAEKMSIRQPTSSRNRLRPRRKTYLEWTFVRVDQIVGEPDGDAEDDQHAADQKRRAPQDPEEIAPQADVAVDHALDDER